MVFKLRTEEGVCKARRLLCKQTKSFYWVSSSQECFKGKDDSLVLHEPNQQACYDTYYTDFNRQPMKIKKASLCIESVYFLLILPKSPSFSSFTRCSLRKCVLKTISFKISPA